MTRSMEFWKWFGDEERHLRQLDAQELVDVLCSRLSWLKPDLSIEVSIPKEPEHEVEVIVSVAGNRARFADVRELVGQAPTLSDWRFLALKPARGFDFTADIGGCQVKANELFFDPLSAGDSISLGVQLYAPTGLAQHPANEEIAWTILETGIGEEACSFIARVDVLDSQSQSTGALPISDLGEYVRWHCARHGGNSHGP